MVEKPFEEQPVNSSSIPGWVPGLKKINLFALMILKQFLVELINPPFSEGGFFTLRF
jgi:hypothetical protein